VIAAKEAVSTAPDLKATAEANPTDLTGRLSEAADVFWLPRRAGRVGKGVSYRRFETLAEAVKFSLETIPGAADVRIYTERGPISQSDILLLYGASTASPAVAATSTAAT
jgi:hypothetical protein